MLLLVDLAEGGVLRGLVDLQRQRGDLCVDGGEVILDGQRIRLAVCADVLRLGEHILHAAGARQLERLRQHVGQVRRDGHAGQVERIGLVAVGERQRAAELFRLDDLAQQRLRVGHGLAADGDALHRDALQEGRRVDDRLVFLRLLQRHLGLDPLLVLLRGRLRGDLARRARLRDDEIHADAQQRQLGAAARDEDAGALPTPPGARAVVKERVRIERDVDLVLVRHKIEILFRLLFKKDVVCHFCSP